MLLCWFLYAPIHELLHAAGCVLAGGGVSEVKISPKYGAALYAKVFPFVKAAESGYAGRLTKFDDRGSDLIYLVTDYFPFLLSVLAGYPLLLLADRIGSAMLAGAGLTLVYVPLMQLPNDYYEMASILLTRLLGAPAVVRSDDAFLLVQKGVYSPWIAAGLLLAAMLALLTWKASKVWGLWMFRQGGRRGENDSSSAGRAGTRPA